MEDYNRVSCACQLDIVQCLARNMMPLGRRDTESLQLQTNLFLLLASDDRTGLFVPDKTFAQMRQRHLAAIG
jgi:hypothetical protein